MRDALGDLAVSIMEFSKKPEPPYVRSRMQRFADLYAYGEPLFHQVIDAGLTVVRSGRAPTDEELTPLRAAFEEAGARFSGLMEQTYLAFEYIGYEIGYFYGGAPWSQLCVWRSASKFLADFGLVLDLTSTEEGLANWGHELFRPLPIPPDMPRSHWWWFKDRPD